jgi:hypothetical protein
VVECLEAVKKTDPAAAARVIEDRVHPGPGGHLVMARALLEAWHGSSVVSELSIDFAKNEVKRAEGIELNDLGTLSWTQKERVLPFPFDEKEPTIASVSAPARIMDTLDREMLTVTGLVEKKYFLEVDEQRICALDRADLERGVNLARLETPMLVQARRVQQLVQKHADIHETRWKLGVKYEGDDSPHLAKALAELDAWEEEALVDVKEAGKPRPHRMKLVPVPPK